MVENLVSSYKCPFCSGTNISEKNIDIIGAAWNTVNIDMHCPSCNKHFMAKTEVMHMELWNMSAEKLSQIKNSLSALKWKLGWELELSVEEDTVSDQILDENIMTLRDQMKKRNFNFEDLFTQEDGDDKAI